MAKRKALRIAVGVSFVAAMIALAAIQFGNARAASLESTTILAADSYLRTLDAMRDLYTSEVVANLSGDLVTHDYELIDGAVPLPATLTILLAERLGSTIEGLEARLYSEYPFPWRILEMDDFEVAALAFLRDHTDSAYVEVQGDTLLRYARADTMRSQCIECHNTRGDSPKTDWAVGDLRGVLAISLPLATFRDAAAEARRPFDMLLLLALLGVLGATIMLVRNVPTFELRRGRTPRGATGESTEEP